MLEKLPRFLRNHAGNSVIAVVAYLFICLHVLAISFVLLFGGLLESSQRGIGAVLYTAYSFSLCFLIGRFCLRKKHDAVVEFLLLLPLALTIAGIVHISYSNYASYGVIFALPTQVLSAHISSFFRIDPAYSNLMMSVLPSLLMWIGMMSRTWHQASCGGDMGAVAVDCKRPSTASGQADCKHRIGVMKTSTKANALLLILSTVLTTAMMILSGLFAFLLPPAIVEMLEHQSWDLLGRVPFPYLITACLFWIAGCFIGIKAKDGKDAIVKSTCVGFGLLLGYTIVAMLYGGIPYLVWGVIFILIAVPGVAVVIIPAILLRFLRSRAKLSEYVLKAGSCVTMIVAYVALSIVLANIGKTTPDLDFKIATPAYAGIRRQVVHDSQFQLERDPTPGREDYFVGFGSFPAIGYSSESAIMVSEFTHQHIDLQGNCEQYDIMSRVGSTSIERSMWQLVDRRLIIHGTHADRFVGLGDNIRPMDIVIIPGMPAESYLDDKGEVVDITSEPVAFDALVFIVHNDNPVSDLSWEQLRSIYAGDIRNWQELGGERRRIRNYQRDRLGHTYMVMGDLVMQGMPMMKPIYAERFRESWRAAAYQNYPGSIGFCLLSFLANDGFDIEGEYRILSIDGVYPNEATIRDGTYPFVVTFYAAIRSGEEDDTGERFLEWILSDEGQACVRQAGYYSLR